MKTYKIPVIWTMGAIVEIEANSLTEAFQKAKEVNLPDDGEYLDGSFEIDTATLEYFAENKIEI